MIFRRQWDVQEVEPSTKGSSGCPGLPPCTLGRQGSCCKTDCPVEPLTASVMVSLDRWAWIPLSLREDVLSPIGWCLASDKWMSPDAANVAESIICEGEPSARTRAANRKKTPEMSIC